MKTKGAGGDGVKTVKIGAAAHHALRVMAAVSRRSIQAIADEAIRLHVAKQEKK